MNNHKFKMELTFLSECCEIVGGSTPSRIVPDYWDGHIHWFTPKDLSGIIGKYVDAAPERITEAGFKSCSTNMIPAYSLLLTSRAPIGHLAINKRPVCTNQGFKSLIPNDDVDVNYLYYTIKKMVPMLQDMGNGATFKELSKAALAKVKIPLPPLPIQLKIAAILDAADLHRQKTKTLIEKYDQLTQSLFLEMFGDPVRNEKGWETKKLEDIVAKNCPLTYGIVQPGDHIEDGVPCVRPVDLLSRALFMNGLKRISQNISNKFSRTILRGGEILISVRGSIGLLSIADSSLAGSNVTRGIVPIWFDDQEVNKLFFYYLYKTKSVQNQIKEKSKGIALIQINLGDLRKMPFITPPIEMQNLFSQQIENIEKQIDQANLSLQKSNNLFNSLLKRAFKGELIN